MKTPTPKQKGIYMTAELYEAVILGRHADIQKGRKGQSLNQSLDEVAEDFKNPIVPYIESLGEVYDLLTPIMFQIHGNPKTKSALGKSLWHTLLLMARDKQSGSWIAQASFANYLALNEVNSAKPFIPLIKGDLTEEQIKVKRSFAGTVFTYMNEARILHTALNIDGWDDLESIAPYFIAKLRLLRQASISLNGWFNESRWGNKKTNIARTLATTIPSEEVDGEVKSYRQMLEAAHYHGVDLVKAIPVAEEEGNQEFVSFAMKLKLEKTTKDKPVVSRVSKDGGKV